jgi:tetratricopeptide (TPR) repeat protein
VTLAEQAVNAAQTLGDTHAEVAARGALGVALRAADRSEEALAHLQAALDAEDGETQIEVLRSLAAAYTDTGEDDAAIALYGRAIQQAERFGAALELAQSRRDLGLVYLKRRELTKAIIEWSTALPIYEERKAHAQVARLCVDIGNARKLLGQGQRAMKDFEQALMTLNNVDEADFETRGLVLSSAANAYAEQGDVESADAFYNESITLADRLGDRHAEATRFGNYGWFLLLVGRPRRALSMLERALRLSQALNLALHAAVQTDNIGLAHDGLGDFASAQEHHEKALDLIEPLNEPRWQAVFRVNLALTLLSLERADAPEPLLTAALEVGRQLDDSEIIIRALTGLASVQIKRRQPGAAESALEEALRMARRMELRRLLAEALAIRSQQLTLLGKHTDATAAWTEAQRLFALLHMPQAKQPPLWLEHPPASA